MRLIITILVVTCIHANAQYAVPPNIRATNTLDRLIFSEGVDVGDMLYGIPMPPGKVIGDNYLTTQWRKSNVLLFESEKMIEGYPVRYDIKADELEFKTTNGIKVLAGSKVKSFVSVDSSKAEPVFYVNAKLYNAGGLNGFFEVVADGQLPLLKHTEIEIKKADYSEALNMGSRDDKIIKKHTFYQAVKNDIVKVPKSRKKFLEALPDKQQEMEKFLSANSLSLSREEDLKAIYEHYNQLNNE